MQAAPAALPAPTAEVDADIVTSTPPLESEQATTSPASEMATNSDEDAQEEDSEAETEEEEPHPAASLPLSEAANDNAATTPLPANDNSPAVELPATGTE